MPSEHPDEIAVRIAGERFRFWQSIRVTQSVDSFDTVELTAPFAHDLKGFRETFQPFTYKNMDVTVGGFRLFTGTMVAVRPDITAKRRAVVASGYALPGVLHDCTPPASALPLEFNDQNLRDIAIALAGPFGLSVEFADDPGPAFDNDPALPPGRTVLSFLSALAKQRNLVIGSTPGGALLFRRPGKATAPVARLRQGEGPLLSVTPQFRPQAYYSDITGVEPVFFGLDGDQHPWRNERLTGVLRPSTFDIGDAEAAAAVAAVESKAGRMFANAVAYSVKVATMRDAAGNLWAPDTTVTLEAPDAMVYGEYAFTIRSVGISRSRDKESAILNLVMPGSLGGQIPEALPWDD